jgi:hypothetical protein
LHEVNQEREAKLMVVAARCGAVCSGGGVAERVVAVGFFVEKKKRGKRRREEGKKRGTRVSGRGDKERGR